MYLCFINNIYNHSSTLPSTRALRLSFFSNKKFWCSIHQNGYRLQSSEYKNVFYL